MCLSLTFFRGVKRCPRCGTINGTRGLSCKNRHCDMVFKEIPTLQQPPCKAPSRMEQDESWRHVECCRLVTDSGPGRRLYSVVVDDKRGRSLLQPQREERGFVVLRDKTLDDGEGLGSHHNHEGSGGSNNATLYDAPMLNLHSSQDPEGELTLSSSSSVGDSIPDAPWPEDSRCYVPGCPAFPCPHLEACRRSGGGERVASEPTAQPLRVKHSVLNAMSISADLKHEIWLCARKDGGPLVQRVSRTAMVVKCRPPNTNVEAQMPLGYLHVTFHSNWTEPRMWCACQKDIRQHQQSSSGSPPCIHFYACVAVFASDDKLSEEFGFFVALQQQELLFPAVVDGGDGSLSQVITILGQDDDDGTTGETIQVEVLDEEVDQFSGILIQDEEGRGREEDEEDCASVSQVLDANLLGSASGDDIQIEMATPGGGIHTISLPNTAAGGSLLDYANGSGSQHDSISPPNAKEDNNIATSPNLPQSALLSASTTPTTSHPQLLKRKTITSPHRSHPSPSKRPRRAPSSSSLLRPHQPQTQHQQQQLHRRPPGLLMDPPGPSSVDESSAVLRFSDWLAGVTERVNQCMHYQFGGRPDPLVFHAPQHFFDCLRERMSAGAGPAGKRKRRLPNYTSTFEQRDCLPRGTFTKYTWKLVNVLQVKQVFDTPRVSLQLTRRFAEAAKGGGYELVEDEDDGEEKEEAGAGKWQGIGAR